MNDQKLPSFVYNIYHAVLYYTNDKAVSWLTSWFFFQNMFNSLKLRDAYMA